MSEHMKIRFPDKFGQVYTKVISNEIPDGVNIINAPKVWPYTKGEGVVVAVIDTGIDLNHPDLKDNIIDAVSLLPDEPDPQDYHGHGTHVSGTIAGKENNLGVVGVAPEAKILSIKVIPASGEGYNLPIPEAIDFARKWRGPNGEKVRVINMSLGTGNTPKLYKAFKKASDSGILMVCASGNDGDGKPETNELSWPAAYYEAISVGAWDLSGPMAGFSNSNDLLDFIAPGVNVFSCYLNGRYATWSGTSMGAPHDSGVAALIIAGFEKVLKREVTEPEVFYAMTKRARDLGFDYRLQGRGLLDLSLHLDEFIKGPAPMPPQPEVYLVIAGGTQIFHSFEQSRAEEKLHDYVTNYAWNISGHIERLSDRKIIYSLGPSDKKIVDPKISIAGQAIATAEQMELYLHRYNEDYPYYAHLFLQEGEAEGIRGDLAYAIAVRDTFFFRFDKGREAGAFNFGMLGDDPTKVSFPDARTGVRAFIQHLKAGANKEPLNNPCVDPFFNDVPRGSRPTLESLSGTWHVPGYDPGKGYESLEQAIRSKDSYHHWIIQRYEKILNTYVPPGYVAPNPFPAPDPPAIPPDLPSKRVIPMKNAVVTTIYGVKGSWWKAKGYHMGIDFWSASGDPDVFSTDPGTVLEVAWDPEGWGNNVIVKTDENELIYAHLASTDVKAGQKVQAGTKLGNAGNTGNTDGGVHLHFEVRKPPYRAGNEINPAEYLGIKNEKGPIQYVKEDNMQVAVVMWSLRDFSAAEQIAAKLGNCGMFNRNRKPELHPDAENANHLIIVGGPEVSHRANVTNLCGKGAPETLIKAAEYALTL